METGIKQEMTNDLATTLIEHAKQHYFGNIPPVNQLSCQVDMLADIVGVLQETTHGQFSLFTRIVAHYAATSTDTDKDQVIAQLTNRGGLCALLECVEADSGTIGIWAHLLKVLQSYIQQ